MYDVVARQFKSTDPLAGQCQTSLTLIGLYGQVGYGLLYRYALALTDESVSVVLQLRRLPGRPAVESESRPVTKRNGQ
jgi:hypothetical protein